jgi:hypothetical protein
VAISYEMGGGISFVQHAVGILTGQISLVATTSGTSRGGGGHFVKIRTGFPNTRQFVAAGYNSIFDPATNTGHNHPHFIVFQSGG